MDQNNTLAFIDREQCGEEEWRSICAALKTTDVDLPGWSSSDEETPPRDAATTPLAAAGDCRPDSPVEAAVANCAPLSATTPPNTQLGPPPPSQMSPPPPTPLSNHGGGGPIATGGPVSTVPPFLPPANASLSQQQQHSQPYVPNSSLIAGDSAASAATAIVVATTGASVASTNAQSFSTAPSVVLPTVAPHRHLQRPPQQNLNHAPTSSYLAPHHTMPEIPSTTMAAVPQIPQTFNIPPPMLPQHPPPPPSHASFDSQQQHFHSMMDGSPFPPTGYVYAQQPFNPQPPPPTPHVPPPQHVHPRQSGGSRGGGKSVGRGRSKTNSSSSSSNVGNARLHHQDSAPQLVGAALMGSAPNGIPAGMMDPNNVPSVAHDSQQQQHPQTAFLPHLLPFPGYHPNNIVYVQQIPGQYNAHGIPQMFVMPHQPAPANAFDFYHQQQMGQNGEEYANTQIISQVPANYVQVPMPGTSPFHVGDIHQMMVGQPIFHQGGFAIGPMAVAAQPPPPPQAPTTSVVSVEATPPSIQEMPGFVLAADTTAIPAPLPVMQQAVVEESVNASPSVMVPVSTVAVAAVEAAPGRPEENGVEEQISQVDSGKETPPSGLSVECRFTVSPETEDSSTMNDEEENVQSLEKELACNQAEPDNIVSPCSTMSNTSTTQSDSVIVNKDSAPTKANHQRSPVPPTHVMNGGSSTTSPNSAASAVAGEKIDRTAAIPEAASSPSQQEKHCEAATAPSPPPETTATATVAPAAPAPAPKAWSSLFQNTNQTSSSTSVVVSSSTTTRKDVDKSTSAPREGSTVSSNNSNNRQQSEAPVSEEMKEDQRLALICTARAMRKVRIRHDYARYKLRGLVNVNNWCYVNAVLQSIVASCSAFYNFLWDLQSAREEEFSAQSRTFTYSAIAKNEGGTASKRVDMKRLATAAKSATPVLDSLITFVKEYTQPLPAKLPAVDLNESSSGSDTGNKMDANGNIIPESKATNNKSASSVATTKKSASGAAGATSGKSASVERSAPETDQETAADNARNALLEAVIGSQYDPKCVLNMLTSLRRECARNQQEDAEEILAYLLNRMEEETVACERALKEHEKVVSNTPKTSVLPFAPPVAAKLNGGNVMCQYDDEGVTCNGVDGRRQMNGGDNNNNNSGSTIDKTIIQRLFGGMARYENGQVQPFLTLALDTQDGIGRIGEALREWAHSQTLHSLPPPYLLLHLLRFGYEQHGGGCKKRLNEIRFPLELRLDDELLSASLRLDEKQRTYRLGAVLHHYGRETEKGHYISDVLHSTSGQWFRCNDREVSAISVGELQEHAPPRVPYLLFYRRIDTCDLSLPFPTTTTTPSPKSTSSPQTQQQQQQEKP